VLVSDFDYRLPDELIAQQPLSARDASRMLRLGRATGDWSDRNFNELPDLLRPDDLIVFNNTRVFPARLLGRRKGSRAQPISEHNTVARGLLQGRVEVLLTRQLSLDPNEWECLVRPGRKIHVGEELFFGEKDELQAEILTRAEFGERRIRFRTSKSNNNFFAALDAIGHIPLPPYISRQDSAVDRERYQTIYARQAGSVAAPTAGLHFTPEILDRIRQRGIGTAAITLHVGLGTFQPVRADRVEDHKIHSEPYSISPEAGDSINRALAHSRRIIAVGTTTVRTLEHAIRIGKGTIAAGSNVSDIFIYPGFEFQVVKAILTNFHLPRSSLLILVSAFAGQKNVLRAYEHAVAEHYRFYSYGDCMFIE
jgi:S-adenosylmethionine:tRNA ribosyltransferase-isomerase